MTESVSLSTILSGSQEVTSLENTDRLVVISSAGSIKKISRYGFVSQNSLTSSIVTTGDTGWLRLATAVANSSAIIKVTKGWGVKSLSMIIFAVMFHPNGYSDVKCILKMGDNATLSKIRLVKKTNEIGYIDIYAPNAGGDNFSVNIDANNGVSLAVGSSTDASIPEGYSATEFTSANWGGVNRYRSICCNPLQKGGQHERSKGIDQCALERENAGCYGGQRLYFRRECHNETRSLPRGHVNIKQAIRTLRFSIQFLGRRRALRTSKICFVPRQYQHHDGMRKDMVGKLMVSVVYHTYDTNILAGKEVAA